jgi:hypothetical protein
MTTVRRLLETAWEEFRKIFVPQKLEGAESSSKKSDVDLGLICGVAAYVLTILAIFEPVRSWLFIVPVLGSAGVFVVLVVWKHILLLPYVQAHRTTFLIRLW